MQTVSLDKLFEDWYLDYASYVILDRSVPHILDGLKPVQRRILHAMREMEDGTFNKLADIIGQSMRYHPHGDMSIQQAVVNIGQKTLFIDTQGNWGDVRTGDSAAAPRYIEARLSQLGLEVLFSPKITEWIPSYDGKKREPLTLPVKFPLLLAQGAEGIASGLSMRILPHNFNELLDAAICCLQGRSFQLYPDFPTGAKIDISEYKDGREGGRVICRATIEQLDAKTLVIRDVPFGITTDMLCDSIIKASDKGKLKIKKVIDNTAQEVEILIELMPGIAAGMEIEALYAFTKCQIRVSLNACVIKEDKPVFLSVSELLEHSVQQTKDYFSQELQIRYNELEEELFALSLEQIFIIHKIYQKIEEENTWEGVLQAIDQGLKPYAQQLKRAITEDDIIKLTEIKIKRISKYDVQDAEEKIGKLKAEMLKVQDNMTNIVDYTIEYYRNLQEKYGKKRTRKTVIENFSDIDIKEVSLANIKVYVQKNEGFVGTSLKKHELIGVCSDLDSLITFRKNGAMQITKVSEKTFVGENIIYTNIFKDKDENTIYNMLYYDGQKGAVFAKRFNVMGITRDKVYSLFKEHPKSKVLYFSVTSRDEQEVLELILSSVSNASQKVITYNMGEISLTNRTAVGVKITTHRVRQVKLKQRDQYKPKTSLSLFFDPEQGKLIKTPSLLSKDLGVFTEQDLVLGIFIDGTCGLFSPNYKQRIDHGANVLILEKFNPSSIFTVVYSEVGSELLLVKRFKLSSLEIRNEKVSFLKTGVNHKIHLFTKEQNPILLLKYQDNTSEQIALAECVKVLSLRQQGIEIKNINNNATRKILEFIWQNKS